MKNYFDDLPDCPICASRPGFMIGIVGSGGEDHWWMGIGCKNHYMFFSGTIFEYPPNTNALQNKIEFSRSKYKEIANELYKDGLGIAEKKYSDLSEYFE